MSDPYLPNPPAAVETSAELKGAGQQISAAMQAAVGRIRSIGDPWGNDEAGNAYRASIGNTDDIQEALLGLGEGVTGFGSVATAGVGRILELDARHENNLDIRI